MVNDALTRNSAERRVLMFVPMEVGYFFDIVCKVTGQRKKALVHRVLVAGMQALFGLGPVDLKGVRLNIPTKGQRGETPRELRHLASVITTPHSDD